MVELLIYVPSHWLFCTSVFHLLLVGDKPCIHVCDLFVGAGRKIMIEIEMRGIDIGQNLMRESERKVIDTGPNRTTRIERKEIDTGQNPMTKIERKGVDTDLTQGENLVIDQDHVLALVHAPKGKFSAVHEKLIIGSPLGLLSIA